MATSLSLFLMPSDDRKQESTLAISTKPAEPTRTTTTTTTRTRKPTANKCQTRKKQPRRGMGVAQLENLRIQERWKAITETNQIGSPNLQPTKQLHVFDPFNNNDDDNQMAQYGTTVNYGVPMRSNGVVFNGFLGWDHQGGVVVRRVDEFTANNNGGFGSGQVLVNPYMVGSVPVHQVGPPAPSAAALEASKELSSIPKVMQQQKQYEPTRCDLCFKMGGFSARAATSAFYAKYHNHNNNEGVEAMEAHRKGNNAMGRKVIMEYELFPVKNGKSTCFKDMEFPTAEASVAGGTGEASCVTTYSDNSASDASNSIDLSLKLSY